MTGVSLQASIGIFRSSCSVSNIVSEAGISFNICHQGDGQVSYPAVVRK